MILHMTNGIKAVAGGVPISTQIRDEVQAEREAQGLGPTVTDPATLALINAAVREVLAARRAA